jgi:hypothetical protein
LNSNPIFDDNLVVLAGSHPPNLNKVQSAHPRFSQQHSGHLANANSEKRKPGPKAHQSEVLPAATTVNLYCGEGSGEEPDDGDMEYFD